MATPCGSVTPRSSSVPEAEFPRPRFCSQCGGPIVVAQAKFCKACGAALEAAEPVRYDGGPRLVSAFVLSVIPGLGHVYQRHPWRGIAWFFGVMAAYGASRTLGFLLHLICAANASLYGTMGRTAARRQERRHSQRRSEPLRSLETEPRPDRDAR